MLERMKLATRPLLFQSTFSLARVDSSFGSFIQSFGFDPRWNSIYAHSFELTYYVLYITLARPGPLSISNMRASLLFTLIALSATPISATFCLLGLPDPLGLCPHSTTQRATPIVAVSATTQGVAPTPEPEKTTVVNTPTSTTTTTTTTEKTTETETEIPPPPPAKETTVPVVVQTTTPIVFQTIESQKSTESTRPAAIPTDLTQTVAPTVFVSTASGPSTTLTVSVPGTRTGWDSTTTLLSVVVPGVSAAAVSGSVSGSAAAVSGTAAAVSSGTSSKVVGTSGSESTTGTTSSRPAQVTTNAAMALRMRGELVVVMGLLGGVGMMV